MTNNWLATTQFPSWLEHAKALTDEGAFDIYAAYLMAYIGLILFCREEYNIPIGQEEIPIRKNKGLVRDYVDIFNKLPSDSETKRFANEAEEFLNDKPLSYYYGIEKRTMRFKPDDFVSVLYFLRNVRNNMVHGHKDFEARNQVMVAVAYALLISLFDEVFNPANDKTYKVS